jgi:hypothetical protein
MSSWGSIADITLAAPAPVQFKTTCAAFINSDIHISVGREAVWVVSPYYSVCGSEC